MDPPPYKRGDVRIFIRGAPKAAGVHEHVQRPTNHPERLARFSPDLREAGGLRMQMALSGRLPSFLREKKRANGGVGGGFGERRNSLYSPVPS